MKGDNFFMDGMEWKEKTKSVKYGWVVKDAMLTNFQVVQTDMRNDDTSKGKPCPHSTTRKIIKVKTIMLWSVIRFHLEFTTFMAWPRSYIMTSKSEHQYLAHQI